MVLVNLWHRDLPSKRVNLTMVKAAYTSVTHRPLLSALILLWFAARASSQTRPACVGDCNRDGVVSNEEVVDLVRLALAGREATCVMPAEVPTVADAVTAVVAPDPCELDLAQSWSEMFPEWWLTATRGRGTVELGFPDEKSGVSR
jgi:hypothetical protein